jgi:hypothetical protein
MFIQKCINIEPKDSSHMMDFGKIQGLIKNFEKLKEGYSKQDYKKTEELGHKILEDCTEWTEVKKYYVDALLANVKLTEATNFLVNKLNHEESVSDEFQYLLCLTLYYDGHYEKSKKILNNLLSKVNDNPQFNHLFKLLRDIEKLKDKGKLVITI